MTASLHKKMYFTLIMILAFLSTIGHALAEGNSSRPAEPFIIADFSGEKNIGAGEHMREWFRNSGWESPLGDPHYFFIADGRLHLVSKPGPVYENRHYMMLFQQDELIDSIENKVLLRVTNDKKIIPDRYSEICFTVAPVTLPAKGADLRDSDKNDSAFYLIAAFDTEGFDIGGYTLPRSIGYVWANQRWDQPIGKDPDYDDFIQ